MNDKEISELRRRFRPDHTGVTHIRGCYVGENRQIIATFDQSLALAGQEESEKYLTLLRRAMSGSIGKNLIDVSFSTRQVADSPEHRLLSALRDSGLEDQQALDTFFQTAVEALDLDTHYAILLAHDVYDVPYRPKDGARLEDASETQFSYILCAVCPVKQTKPGLSFDAGDSLFHSKAPDWVMASPELGFLFPAFDGRATNLYNALYYTRSASENHQPFADAVFHTEIPMPAQAQKETFGAMLADTLEDQCSYDVVQTVHEQLCTMMAEHKESHEPEPLVVTKTQVAGLLESCGVEAGQVEQFAKRYDEEFGADAALSPQNLVNARQLEVTTPDVVIKVNPERRDLVETRVMGGAKYILIRADDAVEVNGIDIHI